jgi:hypothetical protein
LKAFLSHRYRSPEINRYFFSIFAGEALVQFSVDQGVFATNVTRLERLVRDADAFVGIFPYPASEGAAAGKADLEKESRYFRLELDLAERAQKPAVAFIDSRYGDVIHPPQSVIQCRFDSQEICGAAPPARAPLFEQTFRSFCGQVRAWQSYTTIRAVNAIGRNDVGILLPPMDRQGCGYSDEQIRLIADEIEQTGAAPCRLAWPPRVDMAFARHLEEFDYVVVDVGERSAASGIVGYLHGQFVPCLRLLQMPKADRGIDPGVLATLFGAHEVGYPKDIVRWQDEASLHTGVHSRIQTIKEPRKHISSYSEAEDYFNDAAMRKEAVFISYSGSDIDVAAPLIAAFKRRFQQVFDYRTPGEIPAGERWLETIFQRLSTAPVGVPLISRSYFESGNCVHEGQQMIAQGDNKKMRVIPIKVTDEKLDLPSWLQATQYLRMADYREAAAAVEGVIRQLGPPSR